ncbi:uncharacterized protein LOC134460588 [Engraulis encrasicolus]|uniref:uncharacterized protein LOC134460588 n=1 Tax=Engraulis encrasicolus TaxID=184585 RepID=UPI002FCFDF7E
MLSLNMFRIEEVRRCLSSPTPSPVKVYEHSLRRSASLPLLVDGEPVWEAHHPGAQRWHSPALSLYPALSLSPAFSLSSSLASEDFMTACSRLSACSSLALSLCSSFGSEAFMSAQSELSPPCTSPALSLCSLAYEDFVSDPAQACSPAMVRPQVNPASAEAAAAMDNQKMSQRAHSTSSNDLVLITLSTLQDIDTHKVQECRDEQENQEEASEKRSDVEMKKEEKKKTGRKMKGWRRAEWSDTGVAAAAAPPHGCVELLTWGGHSRNDS